MLTRLATELRHSFSARRAALRPRPVRIATPLTVDEAARRLRDGLAQRSWFGQFSEPVPRTAWRWAARGFPEDRAPDRIVTGSVSPSRIRLTASAPSVINSWRPTFRGRLHSQDGRTELVGTLGLFPGVRAFSFVWAGGVSVFFLLGLIITIAMLVEGRWNEAREAAFFMVVAMGMLLFGLILFLGATRWGEHDEQWLTRWLEDRLESHNASR